MINRPEVHSISKNKNENINKMKILGLFSKVIWALLSLAHRTIEKSIKIYDISRYTKPSPSRCKWERDGWMNERKLTQGWLVRCSSKLRSYWRCFSAADDVVEFLIFLRCNLMNENRRLDQKKKSFFINFFISFSERLIKYFFQSPRVI